MKLIIFLAICILRIKGDSSNTQTVSPKPTVQTVNSIVTVTPKPEYYPTQYQPQQRPQYVQVIRKPYYIPQHQQQPTMIIIAQPAYLPANLLYGSATQQLLNYFHSNPQARYQLLHGSYQPQPQPQQNYLQPAPAAAHSIGNYQIIAAPMHYQQQQPAQNAHHALYQSQPQPQPRPEPQQYHFSPHPSQQPPMQLSQLSHLAHQAAQQYQTPIRSAPPIITGFENFSPEQQVKIKAQLSAHFGSPLQPLSKSKNEELGNYLASPQYSAKYQQPTSNEFVPSHEVKSNEDSQDKSSYAKM